MVVLPGRNRTNTPPADTDFAYNINVLLAPKITIFGTYGDRESFAVDS